MKSTTLSPLVVMFIIAFALCSSAFGLAFAWPHLTPTTHQMFAGIGEMILGIVFLASIAGAIVEKQMPTKKSVPQKKFYQLEQKPEVNEHLLETHGLNPTPIEEQIEELAA